MQLACIPSWCQMRSQSINYSISFIFEQNVHFIGVLKKRIGPNEEREGSIRGKSMNLWAVWGGFRIFFSFYCFPLSQSSQSSHPGVAAAGALVGWEAGAT